jgi:uncharacterized protein YcfJ
MKRLAVSALATALIAASGSAFAHDRDNGDSRYGGYDDNYSADHDSGYSADYRHDDRYDNRYDNRYDHRRYVSAQVVRVDPIFDRYRDDSREHCWYEQSGYRGHDDGTDGAILGAIVGGALGNQVGHGDGRAAATIAGAAIGGSIGYNVDRNNGYDGYRDGSIRRCERESGYGYDHDRYDERVVAYDVTYRYAGRTYHAVTDYNPGYRIRVLVDGRSYDRYDRRIGYGW